MMNFFLEPINLLLTLGALTCGLTLLAPALMPQPSYGLDIFSAVKLANQTTTTVVDLRDKVDYDRGHLAQAHNLPWRELQAQLNQLNFNKKNPLILVCANGETSRKARTALGNAGYPSVFILLGGMAAWRRENMPVSAESAATSRKFAL